MNVVIIGGCGFIGQWLAHRLLAKGELMSSAGMRPLESVTLVDIEQPTTWVPGLQDQVMVHTADICGNSFDLAKIAPDAIFHLAAILSGEGELNFDKAMRVNLDGLRAVLETLRANNESQRGRLVFASTIAVFGNQPASDPAVGDHTKQVPQTTYGITKAISELLINEYSRKGFIDGRCARLPTVIVRAGKPNAAASSFCSSVIREPLHGVDSVLPVSRDQPMPVSSYRMAVEGLIAVHDLPAAVLGEDRTVGLPALNVTAGDLVECTRRLRQQRKGMGTVTEKLDPAIVKICASWPGAVDNTRSASLGLPGPTDLDQIAAEYIKDYVDIA